MRIFWLVAAQAVFSRGMPRRLRIEYAGAMYHVTCRGVERRAIFRDDRDRRRFLDDLRQATDDCGLRVFLYCLMPNHVHLVLETPLANLSRFMQKLETAYTVYFNLRHRRCGHLMQGRYGAQLVAGDTYLLRLTRYVHLNPVFVEALRDAPLQERRQALRAYRWSSYREYLGIVAPIGFLETGPLLQLVGGSGIDRHRLYEQYVETGLAVTDDEFRALVHWPGGGIGSSEFREHVTGLYRAFDSRARSAEDAAFRRTRHRKSVDEILKETAGAFDLAVDELRQRRRGCWARAAAAKMLWVYAALNQREIGRVLGMGTGAAVCQQLRSLAAAVEKDDKLARRVESLDEHLSLNP